MAVPVLRPVTFRACVLTLVLVISTKVSVYVNVSVRMQGTVFRPVGTVSVFGVGVGVSVFPCQFDSLS